MSNSVVTNDDQLAVNVNRDYFLVKKKIVFQLAYRTRYNQMFALIAIINNQERSLRCKFKVNKLIYDYYNKCIINNYENISKKEKKR